MNPRQRQMIKEAYQAGYQEALDENIFSGIAKAGTKFGKFLKNLFKRGADTSKPTTSAEDMADVVNALQEPRIKVVANTDLFRATADDLYNEALKAVRTNLDDQISGTTPLPDVAQDFLDEMGDLIDNLFKKVQDGVITQEEATRRLVNRYPGFFRITALDDPIGPRFDDLPGLDP